jgi:hypothetical protein
VTAHATLTARLRRSLESERALGVDFDVAWPRCVRNTVRRVSNVERESWRDALEWSRESWQRAYDRDPATPAECLLTGLFD